MPWPRLVILLALAAAAGPAAVPAAPAALPPGRAPARADAPLVPSLEGELPSLVAAARMCQAPVRNTKAVAWERLRLTSVCTLLLEAPGRATFHDVAAALAARDRLTPEGAQRLLAAVQLGWAVTRSDHALAGARAYADAARLTHGAPAVVAEFMASGLPDRGTYLEALESAPDPAGLAEQLLAAALPDLQESGWAWVNALRAVLLAHRRTLTTGIAASADLPDQHSAYGWTTGAELDGVALELTLLDRQRRAGLPPDEIAPAAARALQAALPAWPLLAADVWGRLRPAERGLVLERLGETNLDLAAALLAFAQPADALPAWDAYVRTRSTPRDLRRRFAEAVVRARLEDRPLDLSALPEAAAGTAELVSALGREGYGPDPLLPPGPALAALPLLRRDPGLARALLDDPGRDRGVFYVAPEAPEPSTVARLLPEARRSVAALEQEQARRLDLARTRLEAPSAAEQRVSATLDRLLRTPLPHPWTERPLPGAAPRTLVLTRTWLRAEPPRPPPPGSGARWFLELSSEPVLDGYWLVEQDATGRRTRTFLALRPGRPHVLAADVPPEVVPGDAAGHLVVRLRAAVEQVDDRPSGEDGPSPVRVRAGPVVLEARLEDLRRDTDGDGLTDLAEAYLLTDPADPDTDHDGLPDGVDPLPQVPNVRGGAAGEAIAAVLPLLERGHARLGVVQSDRTAWRGVTPASRVIVLEAGELDRAREKLGWFDRTALSPVYVGEDGASGALRWFGRASGGGYLLRRKAAAWSATPRGDWVM